MCDTDSGNGAEDGCMNEFMMCGFCFSGFKGHLSVRWSDVESHLNNKLHNNALNNIFGQGLILNSIPALETFLALEYWQNWVF